MDRISTTRQQHVWDGSSVGEHCDRRWVDTRSVHDSSLFDSLAGTRLLHCCCLWEVFYFPYLDRPLTSAVTVRYGRGSEGRMKSERKGISLDCGRFPSVGAILRPSTAHCLAKSPQVRKTLCPPGLTRSEIGNAANGYRLSQINRSSSTILPLELEAKGRISVET